MKKQDSKLIKVVKVVIAISSIIILGITCLYLYELFITPDNISYFSKHFAMSVIFVIIGILAFLLPMANKENIKTDDKGDKMMPIIGIMLFICAIFSCIMSFMTK